MSASTAQSGEPSGARLILSIRPTHGKPITGNALLLLSESKDFGRQQYRFERPTADPIDVEVPVGSYGMQLYVPKFETARQSVDLRSGQATEISVTLEPKHVKPRTFAERLANYGLDLKQLRARSLTLHRDQTLSLDYRIHEMKSDFVILRTAVVDDLKRWVGNPDRLWGHNNPIYGPIPDSPRTQDAKLRIAREYIHGNSQAVKQYANMLNELTAVTNAKGVVKIPIFFFTVVTINAGATLEIGNGSTIFACDELRMHKAGYLKAVGSVKIDVGHYTEFT